MSEQTKTEPIAAATPLPTTRQRKPSEVAGWWIRFKPNTGARIIEFDDNAGYVQTKRHSFKIHDLIRKAELSRDCKTWARDWEVKA